MIGFDLLRPGLAWLLGAALLALAAGLYGLRRSRTELALLVSRRQLTRFLPGLSSSRAVLRVVLGTLGLAFLALAVLGPVRGYTYRAVSRRGLDLVVCLDTSRSMLAQDLRPSRLERARREITGLLDRVHGDRMALVAFSGDARDVAPLTRDRVTLEGLLSFVSPADNQLGGTDLAAAIEHSLSLFDGRTGAHEAIVLLTDGEDLGGRGAELAQEARSRHIRIFVVGVGTEEGGKIPVVDEDGRESFLRDAEGQEVVTRLERAGLESLARTTGGEYLSCEESPTPLEDLYRARISHIEGREIEGGERRVPYDRFQWPLALGLVCLLGEAGLRSRSSRPGRRAIGSRRLAACLLPLGLVAPQGPAYPDHLARAVEAAERGELEAGARLAQELLDAAEGLGLAEPERARAHFACGVIAVRRAQEALQGGDAGAAAERWDEARGALSSTRALAGPGALRLDAIYDLGCVELFEAERLRQQIPEIGGAAQASPGAPGLPGLPGAAAPTPEQEGPDPLQAARAGYLAAREWFVERLRSDWSDEDTRADLELVQRRLHELERIEEQREQQQDPDKKQDPNQDPSQDPDSQQKPDPDQKDPQDQDSKNPGEPPQEPQGPQDPQDPEPQGEPQDPDQERDPSNPEGSEQEPPPSEPQPAPEEPQEGESQQAQPPSGESPPPAEERLLTREQVMQLLDKLAELEKEQRALEARMKARRRAATPRDW